MFPLELGTGSSSSHTPAGIAHTILAPTPLAPSMLPEAGLLWTTRGCPQSQSLPTLPSSTDGRKKNQVPGGAKGTFGNILSRCFPVIPAGVGGETPLSTPSEIIQKAI